MPEVGAGGKVPTGLAGRHDEPADLALDAERLLPTLGQPWATLAPLHRWLVSHVQQP